MENTNNPTEMIALTQSPKTHELLNKFTDFEGRVDVEGIASTVVKIKSQNTNLKKILGFGTIGVLVVVGLMFATVIIGVKIMQDTKIENGRMMTTGKKIPVQTEVALYNVDISLYTDPKILDGIKKLEIPVFVNGVNSTLHVEVLSYLRVPGVKIVFFGTVYSIEVDRHGFSVVQNDPNSNPFGVENEGEEIYRVSRSIKNVSKLTRGAKLFNIKTSDLSSDLSNSISSPNYNNTYSERHMASDMEGVYEEEKAVARGLTYKGYNLQSSAPASGPQLNYYGGPLMPNVNVIPVFWGNNVACANTLKPYYDALVRSSIFTSFLPQYNSPTQRIGTGTAIDPYIDTGVPAGTSILDMDVRKELVRLFNLGVIPLPNENNLYMVHFPPGLTITDPSGSAKSCQVFCAYHSTFKVKINNVIVNVIYSIMPDMSTGGCKYGCGASSNVCDNLHGVASHEVIEAVTDPAVGLASSYSAPLSWYDPNNGEVTDICGGQQDRITSSTGTYVVQKHWSNKDRACVVK